MAIGRIPEPGTGIQESIVDAKGDLISATAADTPARLAVGADGTTLVADSSEATGLKWATPASGGMTLLSTTTLSGAATTVSGISGTFVNLLVIVQGAVFGTNDLLQIKFNGSASIAFGHIDNNNNGTASTSQITNQAIRNGSASVKATGGQNVFAYLVNNYASTSHFKAWSYDATYETTTFAASTGGGGLKTTSAISSLEFSTSSGYTFSAGQILIYGVK